MKCIVGGCNKLHGDKLHNFYFCMNIIMMTKSGWITLMV